MQKNKFIKPAQFIFLGVNNFHFISVSFLNHFYEYYFNVDIVNSFKIFKGGDL